MEKRPTHEQYFDEAIKSSERFDEYYYADKADEIMERLNREITKPCVKAYEELAKAKNSRIIESWDFERRRKRLAEISLGRIGADVTTHSYYHPTELLYIEEKTNYEQVDQIDFMEPHGVSDIVITPGGRIFAQSLDGLVVYEKNEEESTGSQWKRTMILKGDNNYINCFAIQGEDEALVAKSTKIYSCTERESTEWTCLQRKDFAGLKPEAIRQSKPTGFFIQHDGCLLYQKVDDLGNTPYSQLMSMATREYVQTFRVLPDESVLVAEIGGHVAKYSGSEFTRSDVAWIDVKKYDKKIWDMSYFPDGRIAVSTQSGVLMCQPSRSSELEKVEEGLSRNLQPFGRDKILASNHVYKNTIIGLNGKESELPSAPDKIYAAGDGKIYTIHKHCIVICDGESIEK